MSRKRNNDEWIELYHKQRNSGLTIKQWCVENGINASTMADRISRMRKLGIIKDHQTKVTKPQSWVEITPEIPTESNGAIYITIGSFTIAVPELFQEAALIRVCRVLMSLC